MAEMLETPQEIAHPQAADHAPDRTEKIRLFEQILEEAGPWLETIARENADGDDPQDLKQEIMLSLWKSLKHYRGRSSRRTWFYGVAVNAVSNFTRKARRIGFEPEEAAEEPIIPSTGQNRDPVRLIEDFAASLGKPDRLIFTMCLDPLGYKDMAEVLSLSTDHIRAKVSRLRARFSEYAGI